MFGRKQKTVVGPNFQEQLEGIEELIVEIKQDLIQNCVAADQLEGLIAAQTQRLTDSENSLIKRISALETKVANLNKIITSVAEGFSRAMEELKDV